MNFGNIIEGVATEPSKGPIENEMQAGTVFHADLASQAVRVNTIFPEAASRDELQLVQRLFFLPEDKTPRVAVVCGVGGARDGAELVGARVAEVLAGQVNDRVCLVDANLKDPTLHCRYHVGNTMHAPGSSKEQAALVQAEPRLLDNLWILPGSALRQRCTGLSPDWVRAQLAGLRKKFGFVVICAPPLESALDGLLLGRVSDGIVLVLNARSTHRADILKVRCCLERYGIRLLGVVVNQHQSNKEALEGTSLAVQMAQGGKHHDGMERNRPANYRRRIEPLRFLRRFVF